MSAISQSHKVCIKSFDWQFLVGTCQVVANMLMNAHKNHLWFCCPISYGEKCFLVLIADQLCVLEAVARHKLILSNKKCFKIFPFLKMKKSFFKILHQMSSPVHFCPQNESVTTTGCTFLLRQPFPKLIIFECSKRDDL